MPLAFAKRDLEASHHTHRLFWQATFVDKKNYLIWLFTRPLAILIYHVLIPFEVAYCLQAIITRHWSSVSHYVIIILLLGIFYCAFWGVGGLAIAKNGVVGTAYIQREVFSNYLAKDYEFFNNNFVGALGRQATQLKDTFNDYSMLITNNITKQLIIVIASISIIAYQSLILATVTLAIITLVLSFTIISSKWRLKYRRLLSEANSELAGIVGDALGHGSTVKSFATEDYEKRHLDASLKKQTKVQYQTWISSIPADIGRILLASIATVILLLLTSHLYETGSISIAIVVLVQIYVIKLVVSTVDIADIVKSYESIMSNAHQAVKTMLVQPTVANSLTPKRLYNKKRFNINLRNVSYRYDETPDSVLAVRDFSLQINQGERIGLIGYSGSGKTTLTKLLLRFMDISDGSITVDGIDIREILQQELRSHIAYVPQEPLLFHRTIRENISYGRPNATENEILEAGKAAFVDEFIDELTHGYDTIVGEKGIRLSGGQRQRVAIARALLKDAPILVLDEATSALDSRSEQYIQKALWKLMEGRTALVIAHRLSTIQRMDRIIVMDKGIIAEIGSHEELLSNPAGIYAKLWVHQSGGYLTNPAGETSTPALITTH